ncbi:MAG: alpha/beta hydrolase [Planctomycetia bacterium]|nr:alpha/beta hydrolase [Planctomycetia bacterium]
MKKRSLLVALLVCVALCGEAWSFETFNVWSGLAPGESADAVAPTLELWLPAEKTSDTCMVVFPGGGYQMLAYDHEGDKIARFWNSKGIVTVVLKYRVPRRPGVPKHLAAWQDAQRTIRFVRAHAEEWGINPEKIGVMGFSAGGHLTLMTSTTSQTAAYEPTDELDKLPCHVNFAIPVYPAYVLEDGANGRNAGKGNNSTMVNDFAFDAKTPPMCLIHGDSDAYSPMNSVAVYHKLRTMDIPAELHIYATIPHGFGGNPTDNHVGDWLNRVYEWMKVIGY